jgi:hypothetical protein
MILIVDRTSKKQKLIQESLQKLFPGYKNIVVDNGANPFEVLKYQQNLEMIIICEPTTAHYGKGHGWGGKQADHAVEWIEALRHGAVWYDRAVQLRKLIIKPKTKEQIPILYIHPHRMLPDVSDGQYSESDSRRDPWSRYRGNNYPSSFPAHFLIDASTLPKAMKFTKKWYKSIGANDVVFYPWEPEELKKAFLHCINERFWHNELPDETSSTGSQSHGH